MRRSGRMGVCQPKGLVAASLVCRPSSWRHGRSRVQQRRCRQAVAYGESRRAACIHRNTADRLPGRLLTDGGDGPKDGGADTIHLVGIVGCAVGEDGGIGIQRGGACAYKQDGQGGWVRKGVDRDCSRQARREQQHNQLLGKVRAKHRLDQCRPSKSALWPRPSRMQTKREHRPPPPHTTHPTPTHPPAPNTHNGDADPFSTSSPMSPYTMPRVEKVRNIRGQPRTPQRCSVCGRGKISRDGQHRSAGAEGSPARHATAVAQTIGRNPAS